MTFLIKGAILGAGALAIFAALPANEMAVARADVQTYLQDMEDAGFENGEGNAAEIAVGRNICEEVAGGLSRNQAATELWESSKFDSKADAEQFVDISIRDLCPGAA